MVEIQLQHFILHAVFLNWLLGQVGATHAWMPVCMCIYLYGVSLSRSMCVYISLLVSVQVSVILCWSSVRLSVIIKCCFTRTVSLVWPTHVTLCQHWCILSSIGQSASSNMIFLLLLFCSCRNILPYRSCSPLSVCPSRMLTCTLLINLTN